MNTNNGPTRDAIWGALSKVMDPELHRSIVDLGMVKNVRAADGIVQLTLVLTMGGCPLRHKIQSDVQDALMALPGVKRVDVELAEMTSDERRAVRDRLGAGPPLPEQPLVDTDRTTVIAITSGKGGVGKSTVSVNLAAALAKDGARVGLLDLDVYGYSVPRMLGITERPTVINERLQPVERYGIKIMSLGLLVPSEDTPVIWRGPMLFKTVQQLLQDVEWGGPDYLVMDLPPGTGDVAISLAQLVPGSNMVVVTTPQVAAANVAKRAARMCQEAKLHLRGIIENMSYLVCPHGERMDIFGRGGGTAMAEQLGVPLLGQIPLTMDLREASDSGDPLVVEQPESETARVFAEIAEKLTLLLAAAPDEVALGAAS